MKTGGKGLEATWARHSGKWRDPAQICSQWRDAAETDPRALAYKTSPGWWDLVQQLGITLFVTREYEHFVIALGTRRNRPWVTFFPVPHPSGLVVDRASSAMYIASTRNPNQVYRLSTPAALLERKDMRVKAKLDAPAPFVPVSSAFYAGSLYIHDLALFDGDLYANATGHNAVVRLAFDGSFERAWWPKCVEESGQPVFSRNHIQLNSTAAGKTLRDSFFLASSTHIGRFRPGHLRYRVDRQGVLLSGRTREPVCTGLTRPHSARLRDGQVWIANSGYGELGIAQDGRFEVVAKLPGWSRGLCLVKDIAFVATSRVIPRFARYAPGVDFSQSRCAIHAVSCRTGEILGSLEWPLGNQIFAIDWISEERSSGFLFECGSRKMDREIAFFYSYLTTGRRPAK